MYTGIVDLLSVFGKIKLRYIPGDPGEVSWVWKNVNGNESFQERVQEPLGCYSEQNSSTTHSSACL